MTLQRTMGIVRWAAPAATGAAASALWLRAGQAGTPLVLAVATGMVLGLAVVLTLEGVLAMAGLLSAGPRPSSPRLLQLERDRQALLRAMKDIELDASLELIPAGEAEALAAPLRARAGRLLRDLEQARQEQPLTIDEQIEQELSRRLETEGGDA